jgi:short-subunit dehydrogenase
VNRVALITGGSSGIGEATARLLHSRGYRVALVARSAQRLQRLAEQLGTGAFARPCDVGDISSLPGLVDDVVAQFGGLDVLVNNAGVHHRGSMLRHTPEQLAQMITVNTAAPIALTRLAADRMPTGSVVVNVASLAGKVPVPGSATYSGSKAGLRFWALAAAEDLAVRGIRIANVNPGPVDSGFFDDDLDNVTPMTLSQPISTVEQCARAVLRAIETDVVEIDLPYASGKLATLGYVSPPLRRALRPLLEKRGAAVKEQLKRRKQA